MIESTTPYLNDYTLLRDFDLEAAKAGSGLIAFNSASEQYTSTTYNVEFRGLTSSSKEVFVEYEDGDGYCHPVEQIKMKPLFWLEGKPVYVGCTVYHKAAGKGTTTDKKNSWGEYMVFFENPLKVGSCGCIISNLSLSPFPPVKRERKGWINIWKFSSAVVASTGSQVYATKEDALAGLNRFGLVDTVEITWME